MKEWTFITKHGLLLLFISKNPQCTTREMAAALDVTERTIHRILDDLERAKYISRQRTGKANIYRMNPERRLKHELTRDVLAGDLLRLLGGSKRKRH